MQCTKANHVSMVKNGHPVRKPARPGHLEATALPLIVRQIEHHIRARSCFLTLHPTSATAETGRRWRWRADCLSESLPATDSRATRRGYGSSRSLIAAGRRNLIRHCQRTAEPHNPGGQRKRRRASRTDGRLCYTRALLLGGELTISGARGKGTTSKSGYPRPIRRRGRDSANATAPRFTRPIFSSRRTTTRPGR